MDFDKAAREAGYAVYTTDFDEVRDVRQAFTHEELERAREMAESYSRDTEDPLGRKAGTKYDAVELEKAIQELDVAVRQALDETGVDPSDCVIAFLLDNSGSVRDLQPLYARAMSRVCSVLDAHGFDTPVVGHTTTSWKGGESRKRWLEAGRHYNPGRLADMLFTFYKQPGEPTVGGDLRLYGLNAGKMAFKENIDGEALVWIAGKLEEIDADRKTLVFVSDGDIPCDDSTLATNPADYLLKHRNAVIAEIASSSDISLVQVVATTAKVDDATTDMVRFGGTTTESSEFVRAIALAVDYAIRLAPKSSHQLDTSAPKAR